MHEQHRENESPIIDQLYTTAEVAKRLKVSQSTVQEWVRTGQLAGIRYGRLLRIHARDLAAFGESSHQRPAPAEAE